jgi:hypothetical protein
VGDPAGARQRCGAFEPAARYSSGRNSLPTI